MNLITTVVGSYPTREYEVKTLKEKIEQQMGLYDPFKNTISQIVESYVKADIDIICDGQPRDDMVKIFAGKINGFKIEENTAHIVGKITPAAHSIGAGDLKFAYKKAHSLNHKYRLNTTVDDIFENKSRGIKGMITGPTSIVHSCAIDNFYRTPAEAIDDVADALVYEARTLESAGACAVQIDEPFISTQVEDIKVEKEAVEKISRSVDIPIILHVCGDLKGVIRDLLKFDVDILDFEFQGMAQNLQILREAWNKNTDKLISIGCIDTKLHKTDNIEEVKDTIKKVLNITKQENVIIDPDCGMRMLDDKTAEEKLEILKIIKKEGM